VVRFDRGDGDQCDVVCILLKQEPRCFGNARTSIPFIFWHFFPPEPPWPVLSF
jgi:hypothetical protein